MGSPWTIAAASVRGASHMREGLPNQDAAAQWQPPAGAPWPVIAALADGHGGRRHMRSATGAGIAVDVALEVLRDIAPAVEAADAVAGARLAVEGVPARIVEAWVARTNQHLRAAPFSDEELRAVAEAEGAAAADAVRGEPLLAYGATLLAALVTRQRIVLLQLGDGDILAVDGQGRTRRPIPPDERLIGNRTTSICRVGAEKDFRIAVLPARAGESLPALLLLSTDGYANAFRTDEDFLQVGTDFLQLVRKEGIAAVAEQLPRILEHASSQGSGDDVTLALLQCGEAARPEAPAMRSGRPAAQGDRTGGRLKTGLIAACAAAAIAITCAAYFHMSVRQDAAPQGTAAEPGHRGKESARPAAPAEPAAEPGHQGKGSARPAAPGEPAAEPGHQGKGSAQPAAAETGPGRPLLDHVHAQRTVTGVTVKATLLLTAAESCTAEATVWDAHDEKLQSASVSMETSVPDDSVAAPSPLERQKDVVRSGLPISVLVPYPKDEKRVKAMKAKDAKVSVELSCSGKTVTVTKKQAIQM